MKCMLLYVDMLICTVQQHVAVMICQRHVRHNAHAAVCLAGVGCVLCICPLVWHSKRACVQTCLPDEPHGLVTGDTETQHPM